MNRKNAPALTPDYDEAVSVDRIDLEKIRYALQMEQDPIMLQELSAEHYRDMMTGRIVAQIRGYFYGRQVRETVEESEYVPLTWWDHVKQALNKRFPRLNLHVVTRLIEKRVKVVHVCPHLNLASNGRHLTFLQYDGAEGYMIPGLEDRAREVVEAFKKSGGGFGFDPDMKLQRAIRELLITLERHDRH